jgi:hypothetical protein
MVSLVVESASVALVRAGFCFKSTASAATFSSATIGAPAIVTTQGSA